MARRPRKYGANTNSVENIQIRTIQNIRDFEEYRDEILPKIRKMLKDGRKAEEIMQFAQSYAAARIVSIALCEEDVAKAMVAAKDVIDRTQGKAKERTETTHKFEKLKDEELDALLASRLAEVADSESTEH
jgi:hypothetical protein